jgi:hypothetical protein
VADLAFYHGQLDAAVLDLPGRELEEVVRERDQVGGLARGQGAAVVFAEVGVGTAGGVRGDRGGEVDGLFGDEGLATGQVLAGHRGVDLEERVHFGHVPVAGEGQRRPGLVQAAHRPRKRPPGRANGRPPLWTANIGGAVPWLHAGHDPELAEPFQVCGRGQLDVHQLVAGITRPVDLAGVRDGVQGHVDTAVPDRVDKYLEPAGVQLGYEAGEGLRIVEGAAAGARHVGVRLEQRRGVLFHHVVGVQLDRRYP